MVFGKRRARAKRKQTQVSPKEAREATSAPELLAGLGGAGTAAGGGVHVRRGLGGAGESAGRAEGAEHGRAEVAGHEAGLVSKFGNCEMRHQKSGRRRHA